MQRICRPAMTEKVYLRERTGGLATHCKKKEKTCKLSVGRETRFSGVQRKGGNTEGGGTGATEDQGSWDPISRGGNLPQSRARSGS